MPSISQIKKPFVVKLRKSYTAFDDLKARAMESSKAELYKYLIEDAEPGVPAWYMDNIDQRNVRTITKLRTRCHRLAVEAGEWIGIAFENRVCTSCMTVEDETDDAESKSY